MPLLQPHGALYAAQFLIPSALGHLPSFRLSSEEVVNKAGSSDRKDLVVSTPHSYRSQWPDCRAIEARPALSFVYALVRAFSAIAPMLITRFLEAKRRRR